MAARGPYAKGVAKRDEILDAALELVARHGYDRTSVREIARATGLSQAGLLHHFRSKEELFIEVLRRRDARGLERSVADRAGPATVEGLVSIVRRNAEEPGLVRLFVAMSAESTAESSPARGFFEERYRGLRDDIAHDIERRAAAGELRAGLDAHAIAGQLVAVADGLQLQWLLDPEGVDMGGQLEQLAAALLPPMRTSPVAGA